MTNDLFIWAFIRVLLFVHLFFEVSFQFFYCLFLISLFIIKL